MTGVAFASSKDGPPLVVKARMTIDASDWGDAIQGAGAAWDAGLDAKAEYDEPSAPESGEPATDMNPITWCLILVQQDEPVVAPVPDGYDPKYFTGQWGWIDEEFAYTTRRLVDGAGFEQIDHPDVLLINTPPIDYPLDVYPADVAAALEATEPGASRKNIVAMTPAQREIVFRNARSHSLRFLHHLRSRFPKFRRMALSDEFGTPDRLPPKPYVRESLRLVAMHVVREQEVLGFGSRSNYATAMYPDAVFSWQFELDFHPTKRSWTTDAGAKGPWEATFRGNRRFGSGGTGRCVFPLRALVPKDVTGLLGAQKNLGYTSIVSSSCRLHDQSIHAGQAAGAVAAVSLKHDVAPEMIAFDAARLGEVWTTLVEPTEGMPLAVWPFADVDPTAEEFGAIQQLALRRLLPLDARDTLFRPDAPTTDHWWTGIRNRLGEQGYQFDGMDGETTRREAAIGIWKSIRDQPVPPRKWAKPMDADGDGLGDDVDPLPFTPGTISWKVDPRSDGIAEKALLEGENVRAFNFTSPKGAAVEGFTSDVGRVFDERAGFGWAADLTANVRLRGVAPGTPRDGFVFTRKSDTWECRVPNGRWRVVACLGDVGHEQPGQHLRIEGGPVHEADTSAGSFDEIEATVDVEDGRLTLVLGTPKGGSNTCLNWVVVRLVGKSRD